MRNNLKSASAPRTLHGARGASGPLRDGHGDETDDLAEVRVVAASLDRVRSIITEVGYATLLVQLSEAPSDEICAVLDELAVIAEHAFEQLQAIERTQAERPVPLAEIRPLRP